MLVFLRRNLLIERAAISSFSRDRIFLARIEAHTCSFQFPGHEFVILSGLLFRLQCTGRANVAKL
jgi:hypothetical protein